jgi:hypothetical protein
MSNTITIDRTRVDLPDGVDPADTLLRSALQRLVGRARHATLEYVPRAGCYRLRAASGRTLGFFVPGGADCTEPPCVIPFERKPAR